jgi:hypothetical protein
VTEVSTWARRAATLPAVLVEGTPDAITAGARVLERQARVNLVGATGGDRRLSGVSSLRARRGRGGTANREVDVTVKIVGAGTRARALVVPRGPVSLVEGPTRAHRIPHAFTIKARRNVKRRAVRIPGIGIFARVDHPGTRGKRPVERAFRTHSRRAADAGLHVFASIVTEYLEQGRWTRQRLGMGPQ